VSQTFETLLYECDEEGICTVTINRPDKLNALNAQVLDDLESCFLQIGGDVGARGVILTGAGEKSFVAGADIQKFKDLDAESGYRFALRGQAVFNQIEQLKKPVIAAVNGVAAGAGLSFALACDLRIASEGASVIEVFINVGLIPDSGSTWTLPRLVGLAKAMELCMTGDKVNAAEALRLGLVNRVVPADRYLEEALAVARSIAANDRIAVAVTKEAINRTAETMGMRQALLHSLELGVFAEESETPESREFNEILEKEGTKAALAWQEARLAREMAAED